MLSHKFCTVCGVGPYIQIVGPTPEEVAKLDEDKKAYVREMMSLCPVNIKTLNGVNWELLQGNIKKMRTGVDMEPPYEVP